MRLIDADALEKAIYKWMPKDMETWADSSIPPIEDLVVSIMMTIEEQPTVNEWIPVSERLPENGYDVLISDNIGHVEIGCCINGKWYDYNVDEYGTQDENFNSKVLAWQPLPNPYCSMGENYGFPSKEEADLWMNSKPVGKEEI